MTLSLSTMNNKNEINTAFDTIKNSKVKYLPLQQAVNPYINEVIEKLESIQDKTIHLLEDARKGYIMTMEQMLEKFQSTVKINLDNIGLRNTPNIEETVKTNRTENLVQHKPTYEYKSLVLIPKADTTLNEISILIRKEAITQENFPELTKIKKTSNNNLQITSTEDTIQKVAQILRSSEDLKEKTLIIEPGKKKMKILLLRVPTEITEDDLMKELNSKNYLRPNTYEVLKSFPIKNGSSNNWIIQAEAKDCRQLVKRRSILIYTDKIRVVYYLRVTRCTN